jgi:hypothetical protein
MRETEIQIGNSGQDDFDPALQERIRLSILSS